jgi:hypothetical protein
MNKSTIVTGDSGVAESSRAGKTAGDVVAEGKKLSELGFVVVKDHITKRVNTQMP